MARRIVNWLIYNVLFALFPLGAVVALHALHDTLTIQTVADSPEILFFCIMVSATALGDLSNVPTKPAKWDWVFQSAWGVLFLGAIGSALLYAFLLYDNTVTPGPSVFRIRLLNLSLVLAVVYGILGTAIEVWIGRRSLGEVRTEDSK